MKNSYVVRAALLAIASLSVTASLGRAQSLLIPQNIILPNYNRVLIGQQQGLESGAYVARSDDEASNWYNPAGLAQSKQSSVGASGTSYDWTTVSAEGFGRTTKRAQLNTLSGFIGAVLGDPIVSNPRLRLGFGISTPVSWRSSFDTVLPLDVTGGNERLGYSATVSLSVREPSVNVGYAMSDRVRLGGGLGMTMVGLQQTQTVSDRLLVGSAYASTLRAYSTEGSSYGLRATLGAQWDLTERLTLGGLIRTPNVAFTGTTQIDYSSIQTADSATTDAAFRDEEAKFQYRLPLEGDLGLAFTSRDAHAGIEVNVRAYAPINRYAVFSTSELITTVRVDSNGTATPGTTSLSDLTTAATSVIDVAVGGHIDLKQGHRIHAGIYTDSSPVADGESPYRQADFVGASLGYSITGKHFSGSLGTAYLHGQAKSATVAQLLSGASANAKLTVDTFNVFYALSFTF